MSILRSMRIVVTLFLVTGIGIISWTAYLCSETRSVEASLFVEFMNEADDTIHLSGHIYLRADGQIRFNNTETQGVNEVESTLLELNDGSGVYFDLSLLKPNESVKIQINKIEVAETLHQNISTVRFVTRFDSINSTDVGYNAIIKLIGKSSICSFSTASKHVFTVRLGEKNVLIESDYRINVLEYLIALHMITDILLVGTCLSLYFQKIREWFPFTTMVLVILPIFVYVFVGSGWEINHMFGMEGFKFLALTPFLVHGYYAHITNNLIYFGLASVLIETICTHNGTRWWRFAQWYFPPLALLSLLGGVQLVVSGLFSFGLSFAIEAMAWVLWAFILKNFKHVATRRIDFLLVILSGIPSFVFLGWIVSFLFYPTRNQYNVGLAYGHIYFGIVSAVVVFLLVFGDGIVSFIKSKRARTHESDC